MGCVCKCCTVAERLMSIRKSLYMPVHQLGVLEGEETTGADRSELQRIHTDRSPVDQVDCRTAMSIFRGSKGFLDLRSESVSFTNASKSGQCAMASEIFLVRELPSS